MTANLVQDRHLCLLYLIICNTLTHNITTQKVSIKDTTSGSDSPKFHVVGIGASAGGLEAIEQFLSNVPESSGMAYIVIQHLDPTQKGMLPELLQRVSKMKVYQALEEMLVKPNCIYVIPPNRSMSIFKGKLFLSEPLEVRGLRLPVDFFLRSLAQDCKEHAIGLILSGMGSDGSSGILAIKERNGIVMVQDPQTAKFDSMPRNAINSVVADIIAPVEQLPAKLIDLISQVPVLKFDGEIELKDKSSLENIIILLRKYTGNDFMSYKKSLVYRRIERRLAVHKIDKIASYVHFLKDNPKEIDILFKELLIGVTNFFRDEAVWESLKTSILPDYIASHHSGSLLRAWVIGCSTGEEAYSLAIVFKEALEKVSRKGNLSLQIFATDLDSEAIDIARKGIFSLNIVNDVSEVRLNRFFQKTEKGYQIKNEIREMVVFAQHNMIKHPPFTKIDIICCRNLLIYLEPELQNKMQRLFFYSLVNDGMMVLGSSESTGKQGQLFTVLDSRLKIYKRSDVSLMPEVFSFPSSFSRTIPNDNDEILTPHKSFDIQILADRVLLELFSPVGVLVNENGDIIYFSGHTGKYLEPAIGKANMNIFAMLREELQSKFPAAFRKALTSKDPVVISNIRLGANNSMQLLNVTIQRIESPEPLKNTMMVIFSEETEVTIDKKVTNKRKETTKVTREHELEKELVTKREEMQNAFEEMQTSQEELKSTNEELQSTNEELQSTNEELTSSKEEMQSLNEELQTVNAELQAKVDDFVRIDNDMKNLLNSTDIATLFLDKELNIRRFTTQSTQIFKLIKSDIGRPLTDLSSQLIYPDLETDALEVLQTLVFIQKQIPTLDNRWYSTRIMPYRTSDDRIDGLVITFINISELKQVDLKLNQDEQIINFLSGISSDMILRLSSNLDIITINAAAEQFFGKKTEQVIDKNFIHLFVSKPRQRKVNNELIKGMNSLQDGIFKIEVIADNGDSITLDWSARILHADEKMPTGILLFTPKINKQ